MGLSFLLTPMVGASALQAFAVGAALCSTSLGTTFTLLGTSGLSASRLGVVLSSAAMMDDVVGLIMVQIVSNLGGSSTSLDPIVVIRPVFVSLAFAVLIPLACRFVVMPVTRWLSQKRQTAPRLDKLLRRQGTALVTHTAVFVGMVAGATYAGSSSLLGAYIAGAVISWWDEEAPHALSPDRQPERGDSVQLSDLANSSDDAPAEATSKDRQWRSNSGAHVFETYYQPALDRVLKPFFFVIYLCTTSITRADKLGIHWFLNPRRRDVLRAHCLARNCLLHPYGHRETCLRALASSPPQPRERVPEIRSDVPTRRLIEAPASAVRTHRTVFRAREASHHLSWSDTRICHGSTWRDWVSHLITCREHWHLRQQ